MRKHIPIAAALLGGILVWAAITWPLPRLFSSAIPLSERRAADAPRIEENLPGDQFQLLYHFWLGRDVIAGGTPAFANVYEFNFRGDDALRRFETYYIPFSIVYGAFSAIWGHAAGWNAASLFSFLLGLLGTFALARRLSRSDGVAAAAALLLSAYPYRWHTLLTGSPTGFAICLVPWLAYGLDRLVRDCSAGGGAVAGLSLFAAFCSDLHVFYFSVLATPLFCAVPLILGGRPAARRIRATLLAAAPFLGAALAAAALSRLASAELGASTMRHGRTFEEMALFSPVMRGLFTTQFLVGTTNTIYVGIFAGLFFPALCALAAFRFRRDGRRRLAAVALLAAAALAAILLAAGVNGPFLGLPVRIARHIVPKYSLIRQPAKILCLMPTILAAVMAIALSREGRQQPGATARRRSPAAGALAAAAAILGAAMFVQQMLWFRVPLNRLAKDAPAYRAVRAAADAIGDRDPKALAIPLWPGDSHRSAIYEQGVMESRLRLLNGYSPSPPADYFESVFKPLESVNQGVIDFAQYRLLGELGVHWIIFHEDVFPNQVSPFPAGVSLEALRRNPALMEIFQRDRVTAFRIREGLGEADFAQQSGAAPLTSLDFPPSIVWRERQIRRSFETASADGMINLSLRSPAAIRPGMRYMLLDRATGWHEIPFANEMGGEYRLPDGVSDIALAMLTAGGVIGDRAAIRPSRLFHCGTSLPDGSALFAAEDGEGARILAEGPYVPLPAGKWRVSATAEGAAANGAILKVTSGTRGDAIPLRTLRFQADGAADTATAEFEIAAGAPPFAICVTGKPKSEIRLVSATLERLK